MSEGPIEWIRQHVPSFFAYGRSRLEEPDRGIYDRLRDQVLAHGEQIRVPCGDRARLSAILSALTDDCPWIFSVRGYRNQPAPGGETVVVPDYKMSREETQAYMVQLLGFASGLARSLMGLPPEEAAQRVHDHFCSHFTYDRAEESISHTALGPAERGKGVCSGFSMLAKCVFDLLRIPSLLVNGRSWDPRHPERQEEHAWLLVDMGRGFRHMDITQDMALCAPALVRHDYFSLSDEESLQRRKPASPDLPRAAGGHDWYAAHGLAFPTAEALTRHLRAAIPGGQLAFEFRLPREFALEPRKSAVMQAVLQVLQETAGPGDFGCAANEASGVWGLFIRPDDPSRAPRPAAAPTLRSTPAAPAKGEKYADGASARQPAAPAAGTAPGRRPAIPRPPVSGAPGTPNLAWCRRSLSGFPALGRDRLSGAEQRVYDELRDGVFRFAPQFDVSCDRQETFLAVLDALSLDCPWKFFVSRYDYRTHLFSRRITVIPRYSMSEGEAERHMGRLVQSALGLADECAGLSPEQAVLRVHDTICAKYRFVDDGHDFSTTPLGPAERGSGVCGGLAGYAKCVLDLLSIPAVLVVSDARDGESGGMVSHTWLLVNPAGHFFHMDVTFDLGLSNPRLIRHDYFALSDREAARDRTVPPSLPRADAPGYYRDRGLAFRSLSEAEAFLRQAFGRGETRLEFLMTPPEEGGPGSEHVDGLIDRMIDEAAPAGRYQYGHGSRGVWFVYDSPADSPAQ